MNYRNVFTHLALLINKKYWIISVHVFQKENSTQKTELK